jgi:hypothetical protein
LIHFSANLDLKAARKAFDQQLTGATTRLIHILKPDAFLPQQPSVLDRCAGLRFPIWRITEVADDMGTGELYQEFTTSTTGHVMSSSVNKRPIAGRDESDSEYESLLVGHTLLDILC